jgi:formylmethanofuran dehydrogenase subunit B
MNPENFISILSLAAVIASGVIASWVSFRVDSARTSARIDSIEVRIESLESSMEKREVDVQNALKELLSMVHDIKILLAERGIK